MKQTQIPYETNSANTLWHPYILFPYPMKLTQPIPYDIPYIPYETKSPKPFNSPLYTIVIAFYHTTGVARVRRGEENIAQT